MCSGRLPACCHECANWDALTTSDPVREKLKLPPKDDYPMSHLDNTNGIKYLTDDDKITPFEITYKRLKDSLTLAFDNFASLNWNVDQVRAFLAVECFSNKFVEEVIDHGTNARIITEINSETSDLDTEEQLLFLLEAEEEPHYFVAPKPPYVWDAGDDLAIHVDAPMHLIFLGIFKSSLQSVKIWFEKRGYLADFYQRCKVLNTLLDDVKLDWMRTSGKGSSEAGLPKTLMVSAKYFSGSFRTSDPCSGSRSLAMTVFHPQRFPTLVGKKNTA